MTTNFITSDILTRLGAVNAVSLRAEGMPALFSMRRNGNPDGPEAGNRLEFFSSLGFDVSSVARVDQVHSDTIVYTDNPGSFPRADALVTRRPGLALAITVADCVPVLLFDAKIGVVAAVHAGWRGTAAGIAGKAAAFLSGEIGSRPEDIVAYVGPSAGVCCYEVGTEVAGHFPERFKKPAAADGKFMLDLKSVNFSQLIGKGIAPANIEVSEDCTICNAHYHSFRRDGELSGRMIAVIGMKRE